MAIDPRLMAQLRGAQQAAEAQIALGFSAQAIGILNLPESKFISDAKMSELQNLAVEHLISVFQHPGEVVQDTMKDVATA